MGLLDPVYDGVNTVIAGAGSVAGGAVSSVGAGIATTGRGIGDSVTAVGTSWGDYAKDTGNYIMDATKGSGARQGTRSNPLGLERDQKAALSYGMNNPGVYRPSKRVQGPPPSTGGARTGPSAGTRANVAGAVGGAKKQSTTAATGVNKGAVGTSASKVAAQPPKKPNVSAPQPKKAAPSTAASKLGPGVTSGKTKISAESRPRPKAPAGAAKGGNTGKK
ncbi:MAG: hypothetical protein Q9191_002758 [Dirinaria sp. TL-2023a]